MKIEFNNKTKFYCVFTDDGIAIYGPSGAGRMFPYGSIKKISTAIGVLDVRGVNNKGVEMSGTFAIATGDKAAMKIAIQYAKSRMRTDEPTTARHTRRLDVEETRRIFEKENLVREGLQEIKDLQFSKTGRMSAVRKEGIILVAVIVILLIFITAMISGGDSSNSDKKWSELSEVEKENARTAAEIYDYIHEND